MKAEDRGVERAAAIAADERVRIAASDTIESLLETDFRLIINDTEYYVKTPPQVSYTIIDFIPENVRVIIKMMAFTGAMRL